MSQQKTSSAKGASKPSSFAASARTAPAAVEVKPAVKQAAAVAPVVVTHDLIAQRAYLKWKARGGDALKNWTEAESELRAEAARAGR